jgi:hypothetical protein
MCKTSSELKKQIEDLIEDHKERIEYLNEVTTLIIEYINLKITPYSLSDTGDIIYQGNCPKQIYLLG